MSYEEKIYSDIKFPSYLAKNYDDTVDILIKGKIFNNEEIILNSTDSIILAFNPLFSQKEIMDITYEMIVYGPTGDMVEVLSVPSTSYVSKVSQDNNPMIEQTITFLDFLPSGTYIFEISVTDLQSKKQLIQRIPIMYEKNSKISDFRITDIVLANGDYMVSSINKHSEFDSNYLVFVVENMMLPSGYKYQADFEGELNIYKDEQLIKNVKQFFKQNISQNTYPEQMIFTNNFNFNLTDGNYIFELNLVEKLTNTMITKNYSFDYYTESRFDEYLEQLDLIDKNWFIGGEDNN